MCVYVHRFGLLLLQCISVRMFTKPNATYTNNKSLPRVLKNVFKHHFATIKHVFIYTLCSMCTVVVVVVCVSFSPVLANAALRMQQILSKVKPYLHTWNCSPMHTEQQCIKTTNRIIFLLNTCIIDVLLSSLSHLKCKCNVLYGMRER